MRWPLIILAALLILLQYPLWFGKGGWWHMQKAQTEVQSLREHNETLEKRNANMAADVKDLKSGYDAIEERARFELGLVKPGEVFIQTPESPVAPAPDKDAQGKGPAR
ncbi:cell division protein FtsB [Viridibacterium curvum]|uniref:Cell division protein FtsB n=1 Tax=Viridibacterium curvum TaxID=1101404 RepID=A0ABP9QCI2_9RHOO